MAFLGKLATLLLLTSVFADDAKPPKNVPYTTPTASDSAYLFETFDQGLPENFIKTTGNKQDAEGDKYAGSIVAEAAQKNALEGDMGLVLKDKAKHHGIATNLAKPFVFTEEEAFIAQYEVNFQSGIECGGAYVKFFADAENLDLASFDDKTRFTFMFGPDKCASDYKLHFIYNYQNPKTGEFEEKHLKTKPKSEVLKTAYTDAAPHLYKLAVKKDNTFAISLDGKVVSSGNLLEDMSPAINPEKEVVDAADEKPENWDDREKIVDPSDSKPDAWDEDAPKKIKDEKAVMPADWNEDLDPLADDPEAVMPEDWDVDMDGEYTAPQVDNPECKSLSGCGPWEPPMKDNPAYKGKWFPKKIANPDYQGVWKARMIENPDYYEDATPFASASSIKAMAVEIWTMSSDIYFDNFYVGTSEIDAGTLSAATFEKKKQQAKMNEPSIIEKAQKAAEDNKWIMWVITALVGIPLIYFIYSKTRKSEPEVPEPQPEDDEEVLLPDDDSQSENEPEAESNVKADRPEKESAAGDAALPDTEEDEEQGAGDNSTGSEASSEAESTSESEEPTKADGARRRSSRRKAD